MEIRNLLISKNKINYSLMRALEKKVKKTKIYLLVGAALSVMTAQAFGASTLLNKPGTHTQTFDDVDVRLDTPSTGFYNSVGNKTAMYTLLAAVGASDGKTSNTIFVGGENTKSIVIDATAKLTDFWTSTAAVFAQAKGAKVEIQAKDSVSIISNDIGILGQSNSETTTRPENVASISIKSSNISIDATNVAVMAFSNSKIDLSASESIYLNAASAIDTRGNSLININADNLAKKVTIVGDVVFETPNAPGDAQNSGKIINSEVNINLTTAESSWTGRSYQFYRVQNADGSYSDVENVELNADPYHGNVSDFVLSMSNGAKWDVTGNSFVNTASVTDGASINIVQNKESSGTVLNAESITLRDGTLNVADTQATVTVNKLTGSGEILLAVASDEKGGFTSGTVTATDAVGAKLALTATGVTADDFEDAQTAMQFLGDKVSVADATVNKTVEEGAINGAITETVVNGQSQGVEQTENTKLSAFGSVAALSAFQWRHDMNDLTKRMGELRTSPEGIGTWARLYGSEQEYGALQAKNTSIQVGSDVDVGMGWKVGAAFSYTDGNATYADGDADNKAYGLGIYGTWMAENGQFVDLIAKYSRLDTDFALNGMNGGFDNNAYSVSAEYGWHLKLGEYAFVEPQAELTYGQVLGDTFTTGNGVKVEQDDFDAFIGRIGVRGGFHFPDNKGVVYVRASVLHDFEGESTAVASLVSDSNVSKGIYEDLGGTWYEVGVGANFNVTDNTYTYVDLEKTSGGEVKENWRWNVGLRHTF